MLAEKDIANFLKEHDDITNRQELMTQCSIPLGVSKVVYEPSAWQKLMISCLLFEKYNISDIWYLLIKLNDLCWFRGQTLLLQVRNGRRTLKYVEIMK